MSEFTLTQCVRHYEQIARGVSKSGGSILTKVKGQPSAFRAEGWFAAISNVPSLISRSENAAVVKSVDSEIYQFQHAGQDYDC